MHFSNYTKKYWYQYDWGIPKLTDQKYKSTGKLIQWKWRRNAWKGPRGWIKCWNFSLKDKYLIFLDRRWIDFFHLSFHLYNPCTGKIPSAHFSFYLYNPFTHKIPSAWHLSLTNTNSFRLWCESHDPVRYNLKKKT